MVLGIDGNEANIHGRVGVNKYAFEILWGIYKLLPKNPDLIVYIYLKDKPLAEMPPEGANFKYKILSGGKVWIITKLVPHLLKNSEKIDVFFSPSHYAPLFLRIPIVFSIMDLGYTEFSAQFRKYDYWQLKLWTAYSISVSKYILTISQKSASDIVRLYPYTKKKVVVTYLGYDNYLTTNKINATQIERVKNKYSIVYDYILYLGTLKPSKNIEGLVDAFSKYKLKNSDSKIQLVIAGKKGWLYESIFEKVKKLNLEKDVIFTDFIDEKDKAPLIKGALIFALPSFWEGFGLDILSAFALKVPVLASNVGSLPEVVGKAGVLVDPNSSSSIADAIAKILNMSKTEYNKLIMEEQIQLKKFSWDNATKLTLETLRKAVK